jgi:hypothetical protein
MTPVPVARYAKHAKRFGTELVFETAAADFGMTDLGRLSVELQRIDPNWKCPLAGVAFALTLIDHGTTDTAACRMAQITTRTLHRHRTDPNKTGISIVDRRNRSPIFELHASASTQPPGRMDWDLLVTMVGDDGEPLLQVRDETGQVENRPDLAPSSQAIPWTNRPAARNRAAPPELSASWPRNGSHDAPIEGQLELFAEAGGCATPHRSRRRRAPRRLSRDGVALGAARRAGVDPPLQSRDPLPRVGAQALARGADDARTRECHHPR